MSYKQMTGNIISATKVEPAGPFEDSAASGVWNLQDQYDYRRGGNWPETGRAAPLGFFALNNTIIDVLNLASAGDSSNFGTLSTGSFNECMTLGNTTRVVSTRGSDPDTNTIEYWEIATGGSGTDFGDLSVTRSAGSAANNATRGLFIGGYLGSSVGDDHGDVVDYITIANTGNTTDFGNLSAAGIRSGTGNSDTRAISLGGQRGGRSSSTATNIIEYFTIANTGNATDFGDLTVAKGQGSSGSSNRVRAIHAGGVLANNATTNIMDYITIASTGNASDFGDLSQAKEGPFAGVASTVSCFFAPMTSSTKEVQTVVFATTGDSNDFGDLTNANGSRSGTSNSHGGIAA